MKNRKWVLAVALGVLASGAPIAVGAEVNPGPGNATTNLTTVSGGFELADDASSVAANSTAQFDLTAGTLALTSVPNLHFQSESVANLIHGAQTLNLDTAAVTANAKDFDGNNSQTIKVTDYRGTNAGWHVTANLGDFTGKKTITPDSITIGLNTAGDNLTGVAASADNFVGADTALINAPVGGGSGITTSTVATGGLTLPQDPQALAGTYQATVNWALLAAPTPAS